jgi:hypothetical protein
VIKLEQIKGGLIALIAGLSWQGPIPKPKRTDCGFIAASAGSKSS